MAAMRWTRAPAAAVLAAMVACMPTRLAPVHLAGDPVAMNALAGSWSGEYSGIESGRSGSIVFTLQANDETAFGDVVMTAQPIASQARELSTGRPPTAAAPRQQTLSISFVRVADGGVSGRLAPYVDPDLGVTVQTTFIGRLVTADRLEGTFTTTGPGDTVRRGRWRVVRDR